MKNLLFDTLPSNFLLENSNFYLNKKYSFVLGKLNNQIKAILDNTSLKNLSKKADRNKISDTPLSWYTLNVLQSLNEYVPADDKVKFINNVIKQIDEEKNFLNINCFDFVSNGFKYSIPVNLNSSLNLNFGDLQFLDDIKQYEAWELVFIKALEIVKSINSEILGEINKFVKNILVIKSSERSHGSMSPKSLTGAIYLPDLQDSTLIAECLVHESLHQYLYRLEHSSPFFEKNDGLIESYYSPWKDEPRPLIMILHGAFVFTGVLMFYAELCKKELPGHFINTFKERIALRYSQVRIALDVLKTNNKFTKTGIEIFQILNNQLKELEVSKYYDNNIEIDTVLDHMNEFSTQNYQHVSV